MIPGFRGEKDILLNWGFLLFLPWDNVGSHSHVGKDFVWGCGRVAGRAVCRVCQCPRSAGSAGAQSGRARRLPRAGRRSHSPLPEPSRPWCLSSDLSRTALLQEQPYARWSAQFPPGPREKKVIIMFCWTIANFHSTAMAVKPSTNLFILFSLPLEPNYIYISVRVIACDPAEGGWLSWRVCWNNCCSPLWNPICCLQQLLLAGWTR